MAYEAFQARREELYNLLDAAIHSVSYAAHMMEMDPSDKTISGYEAALDYAAKIRRQVGENSAAEDLLRSEHAGLAISHKSVEGQKPGSSPFDLRFAIDRQNKRALGI